MARPNLNKAEFVKSAAAPEQFVQSGMPRIAFAGKSNVGKSSVINRLLNRKNFARVGAEPGKTVHVNYFLVDNVWLVDLPGYGYAKVSQSEKDRWAGLMESYFRSGLISAGVLIVDARHAPTADDVTMLEWFRSTGCPMTVVANKLDKVKKSQREACLETVRRTLGLTEGDTLIPFSAEDGTGRDALLAALEAMA
jgi:GTP-binding protein